MDFYYDNRNVNQFYENLPVLINLKLTLFWDLKASFKLMCP